MSLDRDEAEDVELISASYRVAFPDFWGTTTPVATLPIEKGFITPKDSTTLHLIIPVSFAFLRAIEDWRQGRVVPVKSKVWLDVHWRPIQRVEVPRPKQAAPTGQRLAPVDDNLAVRVDAYNKFQQIHFDMEVQRDQWVLVLKGLGWDEFETFEVPVRSLRRHDRLQKGMDHLQAAQTALRQGQWDTVAVEARRACEAAAGIDGPEADRARLFGELVTQVVPDEHDQPKRETLAGLMRALQPLRHQGAHANIRMDITREDAELALTVAISVFRYMGEALASPRRS